MLSGGGEEASCWSWRGRGGLLLGTLMAARRARPMIVVMPRGRVSLPGITPAMMADRVTPEGIKLRVASLAKLHDAFVNDLMTKIIPYTEKNYRVLTAPDQRAVPGRPMGGA